MTQKFEDVLDAALEAIKTEPVTAVLNRYPNQAEALAPLLAAAEQVKDWQTAVPPSPPPTGRRLIAPLFWPNLSSFR